MADVPITRQSVGNYQNLGAQYSTLPGRVQQAIGQGLVDDTNKIAEQAEKTYLLRSSTTMKGDLYRIEQENQGNPDGMELAFQKYKEGFFEKVAGDQNRALLEEQFQSETMPYLRRATTVKKQRLDDQLQVDGTLSVQAAKDNILKNGGGIFSKDPGAVYDAGRNLAVQGASIEEISKLTKSDGTPMYTPEQRAAMLRIPQEAINDLALAAWAQRPDTEKLEIAEKAMKGEGGGMPKDTGGDTVKPYTKEQIAAKREQIDKPSKFDDIFKEAAAEYGLDWKELKLRAAVESSLNPDAQGPKTKYGQSVGIMQLTEETANGLGVMNRRDARESIFGAAKLLAQHVKDAGGDKSKVDRLYYGGPDQKKWGKNTEQYAENMRSLRGGGADETGTEFDYLTPLQKAKVFEDARDAVNINAMKFATPAERMKIAQDSGSTKVMAAAGEITRALEADPAAYVAADPQVTVAAAEAAQARTPDSFQRYVATSMAAQTRMGVPAYAQRILTKREAQGIVGSVTDAFAQKQNIHEQMQGLQQTYGASWPRVFQELQQEHLPPAAMVLGTMTHETQQPYGTMLSTALAEGPEMVYKAAGATAEKDIKAALATELDDFREANQRAAGGTQVINAFNDAVGLLAAKMMQTQGLDATTAVTKAAGVLTNDYNDYRGTFYVPKDQSPSQVEAAADLRLTFLSDAVPHKNATKEESEAYASATRARGYWVNTPEEDGLILKDEANNYVRTEDGGYVRMTWEQLRALYQQTNEQRQDDETMRQMNMIPGGM